MSEEGNNYKKLKLKIDKELEITYNVTTTRN